MKIAPIFSAFAVVAMISSNSVASQESNFSWNKFMGQAPGILISELSKVAECMPEKNIEYTLKPNPNRLSPTDFLGWYNPTGGLTIINEIFSSSGVKIINCEIERSVRVQAMIHNGRIFSLIISYPKCDFREINCKITVTDADIKAYQSFKDYLVIVPGYGTGDVSADEYKKFSDYKDRIGKLSILNSTKAEYLNCNFPAMNPLLYEEKWRCLVGSRQLPEMAQNFSFVEVDRGTFFNEVREFVLVNQGFLSPLLETEAQLAFVEDVNAQIDRINVFDAARKSKQDKTREIIESLD
jgi:hypothetical protein